ncbi:MAG: hypothetical protein KDA99_23695, partial [Planctomycetales bacterium]|nr:hypothetical protein [Planctomycetales bacterium]
MAKELLSRRGLLAATGTGAIAAVATTSAAAAQTSRGVVAFDEIESKKVNIGATRRGNVTLAEFKESPDDP